MTLQEALQQIPVSQWNQFKKDVADLKRVYPKLTEEEVLSKVSRWYSF